MSKPIHTIEKKDGVITFLKRKKIYERISLRFD